MLTRATAARSQASKPFSKCQRLPNLDQRLILAIVEFELAWVPRLLSTMDYTYRERHGEAIYRFKGLPSRKRGTACCRATSSAATSS